MSQVHINNSLSFESAAPMDAACTFVQGVLSDGRQVQIATVDDVSASGVSRSDVMHHWLHEDVMRVDDSNARVLLVMPATKLSAYAVAEAVRRWLTNQCKVCIA